MLAAHSLGLGEIHVSSIKSFGFRILFGGTRSQSSGTHVILINYREC